MATMKTCPVGSYEEWDTCEALQPWIDCRRRSNQLGGFGSWWKGMYQRS